MCRTLILHSRHPEKFQLLKKVVKNRGDDCDDAKNDEDDDKGNADVLAAAFATLERIVCRSDKF